VESADLLIKIATLLFGVGVAWGTAKAVSHEGLRRSTAAHRRLDEQVKVWTEDRILRAASDSKLSTQVETLLSEMAKVRVAVHEGRSEFSGKIGAVEADIDELKERITDLRVLMEQRRVPASVGTNAP
jgi:hypothetical protein